MVVILVAAVFAMSSAAPILLTAASLPGSIVYAFTRMNSGQVAGKVIGSLLALIGKREAPLPCPS